MPIRWLVFPVIGNTAIVIRLSLGDCPKESSPAVFFHSVSSTFTVFFGYRGPIGVPHAFVLSYAVRNVLGFSVGFRSDDVCGSPFENDQC